MEVVQAVASSYPAASHKVPSPSVEHPSASEVGIQASRQEGVEEIREYLHQEGLLEGSP